MPISWGTSVLRRSPGSAPRRRVPTILQMEAVECGAASLAMVLAYFGRFEPLESLRLACGVSRDGSKASNLLKAARSYGLLAKGYKKEASDIHTLPMPQIVFWNFGHFLVVEGIRNGRVYLNDPGEGERIVTMEEFTTAYTGVTMAFERGPDFITRRRPSPWTALAHRLPGMRWGLTFLILATLGLVLPGILLPAYSRIFFDNVLLEGQTHWVRPLLLAMGLTSIVWAALTWIQQAALLQMEGRLSLSGSGRFFWHVLRLPAEFFSQRYAGDVAARSEINYRIAALLCSDLATNAANIIIVGFFATLLWRYDAALALLAIGLAAVNILSLLLVRKRQRNAARSLQKARGKLFGISMAGLGMMETIKAGGSEDDFFTQWSGVQAQTLNAELTAGRTDLLLLEVPGLLTAISSAAILWMGGHRVMGGYMTLGTLVAIQALMGLFQAPVNGLVQLGGKLQTVEADLHRIDDVLRYPTQIPTGVGSVDDVAKLKGALSLRNITFGYSRLDPPLLEDFSLDLRPGERVALVGSSGSGKSTVARLVSGLYHPWTGEILFDGKTREQIGRTTLARSFGSVDQDVVLFEATVRENLTLWDGLVDEQTIVRATKDAAIYDEILRLPGGLSAQLQEGGRNLSGGQRQRMEIARALVADPRILVLDEATSALDPATEKAIDDALRRRACTCLVIAHRLSTIRDCDEIVMLDRGRVVERGTHDDLVAMRGAYFNLVGAE